MKSFNIDPSTLKKLIADHMENGFLENIIDMFKHDSILYAYVGELMKDERLRVKIGTSALIETLSVEDPENVYESIPSLLLLLKDQDPICRGDAAYILGMIGNKDAIPFLEKIENDEDENVRTIVKEAIEEIQAKPSC
ncbi:MAG TPA: HEAT repeat domain-containing protein [Thermodesulfovibrionales bacterium]|nr:HEAT repeat domain-containing protein [Thermodesulfovibrionales bacterium]